MGKRPQPRLRIDALTGEWRNGEAGEGRGSEPRETGGLRHQAGGASWRASTRTRWGGYHLARPGGPAGPKGVWYPQNETSNLKPIFCLSVLICPSKYDLTCPSSLAS